MRNVRHGSRAAFIRRRKAIETKQSRCTAAEFAPVREAIEHKRLRALGIDPTDATLFAAVNEAANVKRSALQRLRGLAIQYPRAARAIDDIIALVASL